VSGDTRADARRKILQAANRHILSGKRRRGLSYAPRLLNMRQIQWAVFMCRQNHLVKDDLLVAAGFRSLRRVARAEVAS
jgi:hypothetical protein